MPWAHGGREEAGGAIDASGPLADGTKVDGVVTLREALVRRPDLFVGTLTEKLLTYALGRGSGLLRYAGGAGNRARFRAANYRFTSIVIGIVRSTPFQMRAPAADSKMRDGDRSKCSLAGKSLNRRTALRGLGAAVALPFMDAMAPALKAAPVAPVRFGISYFPNGLIMQQFTPATVGAGFEFTPILKPLEPFKDSLVVVTNLTRSHPGSQVGDHAVSAAGFLTGVWPKRTEGEDVLANTTIDQIVAQRIGQDTPLPSLELATEDFTGYVGGCSPGFSCAYMNTISWSSPTTPLPMETNPRAAFERIFGEPGTREERLARIAKKQSILDSISAEAGDLRRGLGPRDSSRLGDYLDNIREIERRIQQAEAHGQSEAVSLDAPVGVPEALAITSA